MRFIGIGVDNLGLMKGCKNGVDFIPIIIIIS